MNIENIWLTLEEVCELTNDRKETIRRKCKSEQFVSKFEQKGKFKQYYILLTSLPEVIQKKYLKNNKEIDVVGIDAIKYSDAPVWSKKQADKYIELINLTENLKRSKIEKVIDEWNKQNPEKQVAYSTLMEARRKYYLGGVDALLSKKGRHRKGLTKLDADYYEYFKSLYLKEGAPSAQSSWRITLGYAQKNDKNISIVNFPTCPTFLRKLREDIPEQAIYLARYGNSAWYKKYANYIPRDYSSIMAGAFWVSDHAQIDVAVNFNGNICFPWVTVFRDIKTSKWLGWFLHADSPNSDHIFQAFYYGVVKFGLPEDVYLDNGKDYRCKDFAGGRSSVVKVKHSDNENSLLRNINVNVHFALPYNAQTKPVERDFLKVKTFLSKHFVGYRGGKITERPEKLKDEIKSNAVMQFEDFKVLFDDFIENVLNKVPSKGKVLQGRCPDEVWAEEFTNKRVISRDALKLFCMRTSKNVSIGRNGVYDSQLQLTYWDEWMIAEKGRKVYIRRDINAYQEAWVFDANTEEFLGKANVYTPTSFMAKTNVEKIQYKKAVETKKKEKKLLQGYLKTKYNPTNEEIISNLKNSLPDTEFVSNPAVSTISNTKLDRIVKAEKKNNLQVEKYVTPLQPKKKLYLTESEKRRALEQQAM